MKPTRKPVKPFRRTASSAYRSAPIDEDTVGRLFRVRDKDWETVWGENLTYEAAHKLKELVVGRGKSRTARIEDMEIQPPDWYADQMPVASGNATNDAGAQAPTDVQLEALRAKAKAVAAATAAEAQARHQRAAARDRSSGAAAVRTVAPRPVPVISTESPLDGDGDEGDGVGYGDLSDLMADAGSDVPSDIELARAKEVRDRDVAALTAKAKAMYEAQATAGHCAWEQLSKAAQAGWRFEAANSAEPVAGDTADAATS